MTEENLNQLKYGNYQTPIEFAIMVCDILKNSIGIEPNVIIEPTCGAGNFISASLKVFNDVKKVHGVEIQDSYYRQTSDLFKDNPLISIVHANIFTHEFDEEELKKNKLLIIGNPPWVTNSTLGTLDLDNLPEKKNFKGFKGLDAITGKGNFDIAEYIILQLINEFSYCDGYIAMLCKNIVVKNILENIRNYNFNISDLRMYNFSAKDIFNASCEASLFVAKIGTKKEYTCKVYDIANPDKVMTTMGWVGDKFVSDITAYESYIFIDNKMLSRKFEWRQGIKHDCSKVMEFKASDNKIINGLDETFEINGTIEDTYLYGLLKSSNLKTFETKEVKKKVIVTQKKIKEDTSQIQNIASKTWDYLISHEDLLNGRKSSIYKKSPKFAIFGVGDYSYARYKVAISGMYKKPQFSLVHPTDDKPTMLDDTCYFLNFDNYQDALITCALLNSNPVQQFLLSIAFLDNKRPYTKDILMRIDIIQVAKHLSFLEMNELLKINNVEQFALSEEMYENYISKYSELTLI